MAKIKFENGVTVNFNGNPTPQDIEEVAKKLGITKNKSSFGQDVKESFKSRTDSLASGYLRQQQGKQSLGESVLQTVGQGAGLIGDVAFSGISRVASAITPDFIEKPVVSAVKSGATKLLSTKPAQSLISGYQKFEEEQPRAAANIGSVGNIASLIPIGKGGQIAGKTALKATQNTGKAVGKAAIKASELGSKTTKFGLSQVSGLNRETIEQVIKNPKMFTKEVVADMTRENIGKQIKSGITSRINQLQSIGKEYEPLRKLNKVIDVPATTYTDILDKYGLKISEGRLLATAESKPFLSGELKQVEDFISQYGSVKHTPNSALNARESLSNLAKFDTAKSTNLTSIAKDFRINLNKIIQNDKVGIPGIKQLDDFYSKEIGVLKDIRKDYFVKGTTEFKDNALSKIANLTKEGRQSVLKRLKEIDPNIDFKVNILRAIEDIKASGGLKVGTYTRAGVAGSGIITGNIPLLLGALAAQPEILVPILRAFGNIRNTQKAVLKSIESKLRSGADLLLNEKSVLNQAIDDYAKKIGEKVKNIKPGLTVEDVSLKGKGETLSPKNFKTAEDYVKAQATKDGVATRFGEISKDGAYFSKQVDGFENKNYFNAKTGNIKNSQYDISRANIVKSDTKEALTILKEALKDTKNTPQDIIRLKREINSANEYGGKAIIDWRLNDEIPSIVKSAKKLGYDGINVIETGDVSKPTSLFIWNTNKINELKTKSQLISEWNKAQPLKNPLIQKAKKYKSADDFIKAQLYKKEYRSAHQLSLSDSITADKIDIPNLKEAIRTRNGYLNNYNLSDLKKLEKLKNNPDADIKIFRASPKNELNDGDWVTTDKTYANDIKRQNGGKVYEYTVKVKDLRFPKDVETLPSLSMASTFSYSPKTSQLTDIWNKAQKLK